MRFRKLLLACGIGALCAGCNSVLGTDQSAFANDARVIVEGNSAVPLQLITSTNFTALPDSETGELIANDVIGDTIQLTTFPFQRTYTLVGYDRFLVRLTNPDLDVTATVHLRIELDGRLVYTQRATMRDASLQYIAFHGR